MTPLIELPPTMNITGNKIVVLPDGTEEKLPTITTRLTLLNETDFFNLYNDFNPNDFVDKKNNMFETLALRFETMCSKSSKVSDGKYPHSAVSGTYIQDLLIGINKKTNDYRFYVSMLPEQNGIGFYDRIVNILIYKTGCKSFANTKGVDNNKIMQYTVICQNASTDNKLETRSTFISLTCLFFRTLKQNGYKYVILEAAGNFDFNDKTPCYGKGAAVHLLVMYADWGFVENPDISLKHGCFDKKYPYNSMVLDLDDINYKELSCFSKQGKDARLKMIKTKLQAIVTNPTINPETKRRLLKKIYNVFAINTEPLAYNYKEKHKLLELNKEWDAFIEKYPSLEENLRPLERTKRIRKPTERFGDEQIQSPTPNNKRQKLKGGNCCKKCGKKKQ